MATIENMTNISVPAEVSADIFTDALEVSGLTSLAANAGLNLRITSDPRDRIAYDVSGAEAFWHNPTTNEKTVTTDTVKTVNVPMYDLAIIWKVQDHTDLSATELINQLKLDAPKKLGEALQKTIFGGTAEKTEAPFGGTTTFGDATAIDTTSAAAWAGVIDGVDDASGLLLNSKVKSDLKTAVTTVQSGVTINPLTFGIDDGYSVAGVPAYFVKRTKSAANALAGIVGDWSKAVLYLKNDLTLQTVDGSTDFQMMKEDARAFKLKWRAGFAIADKKYFSVFKKNA